MSSNTSKTSCTEEKLKNTALFFSKTDTKNITSSQKMYYKIVLPRIFCRMSTDLCRLYFFMRMPSLSYFLKYLKKYEEEIGKNKNKRRSIHLKFHFLFLVFKWNQQGKSRGMIVAIKTWILYVMS